MPRATATVLSAFTNEPPCAGSPASARRCHSGGCRGDAVARAAGDHLGDVVPGELDELVAGAGLVGQQQPQEEGGLLFGEENVPRPARLEGAGDEPPARVVLIRGPGPAVPAPPDPLIP